MKKHFHKLGRTMILLTFFLIYAQGIHAQTCTAPLSLTINDCDNYTVNDSVVWLSFNSGSGASSCNINISAPNNPGSIVGAELYSGNCTSLTLVQSGFSDIGEFVIRSTISASTNYLVKVTRSNATSGTLNVCSNVAASVVPCPQCTTTCQLVCNPDLESHQLLNNNQHPANFVSTNVCNWGTPGASTPDYFTDSTTDLTVQTPTNFQGTENPHSGSSYGGIYCFYNIQGQYREYLQHQLQTPLTAGQSYTLTFWVSLSDYSGYAVNHLGAYVSAAQPTQAFPVVMNFTPQVVGATTVTSINGWVPITGTFVATGGEQWITIGSFETDQVQQQTVVVPAGNNPYPTPQTNPNRGAYYYIDDITLTSNPDPFFTWSGICRRVDFVNNPGCIDPAATHHWNFGDPLSGANNTSTAQNPSHVFTQSGVPYTVTHTIFSPSLGFFTYSTTVVQPGGPGANISGYATNNCGSGTITYGASPCDPNLQYSWTVTGGTPTSGTGCSINVNWSTPGGFIYLTAWDPKSDCYSYDTLQIPPCCNDPGLHIDNHTASWVLTDPSFAPYVTGNTVNGATFSTPLIITGVFTIDVPITFINCPLVYMGGNTPVVLNSGQNIIFSKCTLDVKCNYMWDGTYVPDPSASVTFTNNCVVKQAKNVIVSNNGGNFLVENSKLIDNYKGIVVNAYSGVHTGVVRNTDFTMVGNFAQAMPALPFGHNKTVCGIEINNTANITIGDASLLAYRNRFDNILVGIRCTRSNVKIVNAAFSNLQATFAQQNVPNAGTGVVSTGGRSLIPLGLTVGGAGFARCSFTDMRYGIDCYEPHRIDINSNNILKVRFYPIRIQRDRSSTINVDNNFITNQTAAFAFQTAILMLECYQSTIGITNNNIQQCSAVPSQNGVGIQVGLVTPGDVILDVIGNTIARTRTGIWTQQLVGLNHVNITSNTINFQKPNVQYTSFHYGVRLENCATVRVRYNTITKTNPAAPTAAMIDNLRGVSFENSTKSIIAHNTITRMGSGIYGWEICTGSSLACNALVSCYDGFFFAGGASTFFRCDVGFQLLNPNFSNPTPAPTGNTWSSSVGSDIAGGIAPTIRWYRNAYSPTLTLLSNSLVNNATDSSANPSGCTIVQFITPAPGTPAVEREQSAGQPVLNPSAYTPGSEQGYQGRRIGHRALRETPLWMTLGTPQDSLYAGFYTTNETTNVGLFRNFEDMAAVDSVQASGNILTSITDTNNSETNLKVVYSIYQQTWMQGVYEFSGADSAILYNIAVQHASDAGEAVYAARVMLNLQVDEYAVSGQRLAPEPTSEDVGQTTTLYPNPANDQVNGSIELTNGQQAVVTIIDLQGKIVLTQAVIDSGLFTIDASGLDVGLYFVQTAINGELIETNKLEIIHE